MRLVVSRFVSLVPIGGGLYVCGHAFRGPRTVVDEERRALFEAFRAPRTVEELVATFPSAQHADVRAKLDVLRKHELLVDADRDEVAGVALAYGANLDTARTELRRAQMRSRVDPRVRDQLALDPVVAVPRETWSVVVLGRCVVLPSMDVLVTVAAERGYTLDVAASFPEDVALVAERAPDFVVVGDLARVGLGYGDARPVQYVQELRALLGEVRARTAAPILVFGLPVPSYALTGLAGAGATSTIDRVRQLVLDVSALVASLPDVYLVDVDRVTSFAGKRGLLDDSIVVSHHLGSATWLLERARREPLASAPSLATWLDAGCAPLEAERLIAEETLRVMRSIRGRERCKCIVVDLDDTLWPGVLAETGAPFPPELPVDVYPQMLYLGLHEALLALRDRGILLACVSKNDLDVVRELWQYPPEYAHLPRLQLSDFVTYRIDWNDKVDNVLAIADELGIAPSSIAVIDDHPLERARLRGRLPEVMVLGENPLAVRRHLLTDPAFEVPQVTDEARRRHGMVKAQLERDRARTAAIDDAAFLAGLDLCCTIRKETGDTNLSRIAELVSRTTQLNTTGAARTREQLANAEVYSLSARDRYCDYGLVGACIVEGSAIAQLVLSCRVISLRLDQVLLRAVASAILARSGHVTGHIVATSRNHPARDVFRSSGFQQAPDGSWTAQDLTAASALPPVDVTLAL